MSPKPSSQIGTSELHATEVTPVILAKFHIDQQKWDALKRQLCTKNQAAYDELQQTLLDIWNLAQDLAKKTNADMSSYELINWSDILFRQKYADPNIPIELITDRFTNASTKKLDDIMNWTYLGMTLAGLVFSVLTNVDFKSLQFLKSDLSSQVQDSSWNYIDGLGAVASGFRQFAQGEKAIGIANLFSAGQIIASTITTDIANFSSAISLSATTISGLIGFSFAATLVVSCGIELYQIKKCDKRLEMLQSELSETIKEIQAETRRPHTDTHKIGTLTRKMDLLEESIKITQAQRENHIRSAKSWAACAVIMTTIAVIAYIGLSAATFGGLPVATIALSAVALVTGLIRNWWVNHKDHVKEYEDGCENGSDKINPRARNDSFFGIPSPTPSMDTPSRRTSIKKY